MFFIPYWFGVALFSSFLLSNQYSWTSSFRGVIRGFTLPHKPIDSIDWSAVNREEEFDGPKSFNLPQIQFFFNHHSLSVSLSVHLSDISSFNWIVRNFFHNNWYVDKDPNFVILAASPLLLTTVLKCPGTEETSWTAGRGILYRSCLIQDYISLTVPSLLCCGLFFCSVMWQRLGFVYD